MMKQEYEAHLSKADKEAEAILADARRKAQKNEAVIVAEAKEEAARIMKRADVEIELERRKALEGMKQEVVDIAVAMAQKAVGEQMNVSVQSRLLEETLQEMGEDTWQNEQKTFMVMPCFLLDWKKVPWSRFMMR